MSKRNRALTSHAARVFVIPQMILDLIVIGPRVRPFLGAAPARPPATVTAETDAP